MGNRPPPPPPKPKKPAGPAVIAPKVPVSQKQRRRMLKAAAWRLAAILRVRPATLISREPAALESLVDEAVRMVDLRRRRGEATRLAAKIVRLRRK